MDLLTTVYLIIDAGGTFLKSAILNAEGEVLEGSSSSADSFSDGSKEDILQAFRDAILKGLEYTSENNRQLKGIGVAFPGPFDIYHATPLMKHKFQNILGLNLRDFFSQIPGVPANISINFIHDANAVLEGEIGIGNAKGFSNVAVITLGTGLGFAISENGKVLRNKIGGPFISIFKLPYKDGILEDYISKRGFLNIYQEISGIDNIDNLEVLDLAKQAEQGDEFSIQTFTKVGETLAQSIRDILIERNIQCLLFSGQISRSFHLMEHALKEGLQNVECLKKISKVKSINDSALIGAFLNISQKEE